MRELNQIMIYFLIISLLLNLLLISLLLFLDFKMHWINKILTKLKLLKPKKEINFAIFSWNNMIEKMNYHADVVFIGDSRTRGINFQNDFPNKKIVNLGYSGDTLEGMTDRISMVRNLTPTTVFVGGV